jgi:hypothetical protein
MSSHDGAPPASISTPDVVETSIGSLTFKDGIPDGATSDRLYDRLGLAHAVEAYLAGLPGVSMMALRKGFLDVGVADNTVLIFSRLMDGESLFLTANADTVYFLSHLDLSDGPLALRYRPTAWAPSTTCGSDGRLRNPGTRPRSGRQLRPAAPRLRRTGARRRQPRRPDQGDTADLALHTRRLRIERGLVPAGKVPAGSAVGATAPRVHRGQRPGDEHDSAQRPLLLPAAGRTRAGAVGDGSHTVHFASARPGGLAEGDWIRTTPGKGWFTILRLYSPRQSFFDRTWRPTEITPTT